MAGGEYPYRSSAELYHPLTGTWTNTANMHVRRAGHAAALLPNGMVLVAAGSESDFGQLSSAELYDPLTRAWRLTASMFAKYTHHTMTILPDGKVLVAGGWFWGGPNGTYLSSAELYVASSPIRLTSPSKLVDGPFAFTFTNTPGDTFNVLTATNPSASDWTMLGTVTEVSPGQFQFIDAGAATNSLRFYRVRGN